VTVRLVIADDHALVRAGFRRLLDSEPGIDVVGEASTGRDTIDAALGLRPDIVLMDIRMPELDGIEATRRILASSRSRARIIILTTFDLDEYVYDALKAGASGFLLKDAPPEQLIHAIHTVAGGDALLAPSVTRRLVGQFARRPAPNSGVPAQLSELTPRALETLRLLGRGLTNAEIAQALVVGEAAVKTHVSNMLLKLALRDRVQAVVIAYETGLIQPGTLELPSGSQRPHARWSSPK
jgi:DNA-binding NarL/FixJ family response regulator